MAGSQGSGRVHNYFATCPVTSEEYRSGVRAYRGDQVGHREVALDQRLGNGSFPQGKAYHEQTLPWLMQRMSTLRSKSRRRQRQPAGPPSTHMTVEVAVANRSEAANPLSVQGPAAYPCLAGQAECYVEQHHGLRCRHRLSESRGEDRRFLQAAARRNRILDTLAAAGVSVRNLSPRELQKLVKRCPEEERGQMSYEARAIRGAKDKMQRAKKIKGADYKDLADRFDKDSTFAARQAENGLTRVDMQRIIASGYLPAQVILGAGSQANFRASKSEVNAKMVIFDGVNVEDTRAVGMADSQMNVSMCIGWHGAFMDVSTTFAGLALGDEDARRILTFNGMMILKAATLNTLKEEINALIMSNHEAAKAKVRSDQPARAKQSAVSKAKAKADPATSRQLWSSEDWGWRLPWTHLVFGRRMAPLLGALISCMMQCRTYVPSFQLTTLATKAQ